MIKQLAITTIGSSALLTLLNAQEKPNIVWLMAENISTDLECYGRNEVKTPVLNQLAEEGVRFTHCYCTSPVCSPSRSALMTGVHQNRINAQHHRSNRDIPLPEPYKPFTYYLRQAGYTCILGSELIFLNDRKTDCNFMHTQTGPYDGKTGFGLFDKLDTLTHDDQPFFVQIQLNSTHRGEWYDSLYLDSKDRMDPDKVILPPYLADDSLIRFDWARYLEMIEYSDYEVGKIVKDLADKGLDENTIIVYASDNGRDNFRGIGYLYDAGIHVPLIIHWPKKLKPAVRTDLVSNMDITATILSLAGIEIPSYMTGKNIFAKDYHRDYVYSTRDLWDEIMERSRSITELQYKYIRNDVIQYPYDRGQAWLDFVFPTIHVMRKWKVEGKLNQAQMLFMADRKPPEELYDLVKDPFELDNLSAKSEYQDVLIQMREKLNWEEKQMQSDDTTLHAVIPVAPSMVEWVKYTKPDLYADILKGRVLRFFSLESEYIKFLSKKDTQVVHPE